MLALHVILLRVFLSEEGTVTASALLRAARSHRGTQRALADAAGIHQPRVAALEGATEDATVNRLAELLRVLGAQLALVPSELRPVWAVADDVRRALGEDNERTAWREIIQLNDDLRAADAATCVTLAIAPLLSLATLTSMHSSQRSRMQLSPTVNYLARNGWMMNAGG